MRPVEQLEEHHLAYWSEQMEAQPAVFLAPDGLDDGCSPCTGVVTRPLEPGPMDGMQVVRVAWRPDDEDLAALAAGGVVWLSTWGGLPPHMLEVQG